MNLDDATDIIIQAAKNELDSLKRERDETGLECRKKRAQGEIDKLEAALKEFAWQDDTREPGK